MTATAAAAGHSVAETNSRPIAVVPPFGPHGATHKGGYSGCCATVRPQGHGLEEHLGFLDTMQEHIPDDQLVYILARNLGADL